MGCADPCYFDLMTYCPRMIYPLRTALSNVSDECCTRQR